MAKKLTMADFILATPNNDGEFPFNQKKENCENQKRDFQKKIYYRPLPNRNPMRDKSAEANFNDILNKINEEFNQGYLTSDYLIPADAFCALVAEHFIRINTDEVKEIEQQRASNVMSPEKKSWLIIAMINNLMSIPQIEMFVRKSLEYAYPNDGQQRTQSISSFMRNEWEIVSTGTVLDGHVFRDLPHEIQDILRGSPVRVCFSHPIKDGKFARDNFIVVNSNRTALSEGEKYNARFCAMEGYKEIQEFANTDFHQVMMFGKDCNRQEQIKNAIFCLSLVSLDPSEFCAGQKGPIVKKMMNVMVNDDNFRKAIVKMIKDPNSVINQTIQTIRRCVPEHMLYMFDISEKHQFCTRIPKADLLCYEDGYQPKNRKYSFGETNGNMMFYAMYNLIRNGFIFSSTTDPRLSKFLTQFEKLSAGYDTRNIHFATRVIQTREFLDKFMRENSTKAVA